MLPVLQKINRCLKPLTLNMGIGCSWEEHTKTNRTVSLNWNLPDCPTCLTMTLIFLIRFRVKHRYMDYHTTTALGTNHTTLRYIGYFFTTNQLLVMLSFLLLTPKMLLLSHNFQCSCLVNNKMICKADSSLYNIMKQVLRNIFFGWFYSS